MGSQILKTFCFAVSLIQGTYFIDCLPVENEQNPSNAHAVSVAKLDAQQQMPSDTTPTENESLTQPAETTSMENLESLAKHFTASEISDIGESVIQEIMRESFVRALIKALKENQLLDEHAGESKDAEKLPEESYEDDDDEFQEEPSDVEWHNDSKEDNLRESNAQNKIASEAIINDRLKTNDKEENKSVPDAPTLSDEKVTKVD